ncbi:TetR/AcrR family transcriptional regulator [Streptomyces parvus]|uniref:TetR family transcriptional regulator n=1 Tax=Streptomyces parvus TaxID=66428 RepID=A0A5D4IG07_9ACTN|nr:TetR family transcriptional regulator [Streptomyces parvus]TYR51652.1 TetR family transcriptional regulator [Streptomyces parvus]
MNPNTAASPGPRKRDPEATRQAILGAAAEITVQQGAAALTHRSVAARAGVALGSTTRYFASIDDLREATLRMLGGEVDAYLARVELDLASCEDLAESLAGTMHDFLVDSRQVHATLAMITAAASDTSMRSLALRWTDRLDALLTARVGSERAVAAQVYIDGATIHAALHEAPLSRDTVAQTLRAIFAMPDTGGQ